MMAAVPSATVVITNPTHVAVALRYEPPMAAPRLVAKGAGPLAERIRALARAHRVPVVENPPLARALHASVELEAEIPPAHYRAVAEVIGYVMTLRARRYGPTAVRLQAAPAARRKRSFTAAPYPPPQNASNRHPELG